MQGEHKYDTTKRSTHVQFLYYRIRFCTTEYDFVLRSTTLCYEHYFVVNLKNSGVKISYDSLLWCVLKNGQNQSLLHHPLPDPPTQNNKY